MHETNQKFFSLHYTDMSTTYYGIIRHKNKATINMLYSHINPSQVQWLNEQH